MAIQIGNVQSVSTRSRDYGWGFSLKDSTAQPARWCMIAYRTEAGAKAARALRAPARRELRRQKLSAWSPA